MATLININQLNFQIPNIHQMKEMPPTNQTNMTEKSNGIMMNRRKMQILLLNLLRMIIRRKNQILQMSQLQNSGTFSRKLS